MTLGTGMADLSKAVSENMGQGPVLPHTHRNDKAGGEGHLLTQAKWVDLGWPLAAHQTTFSLPLFSRTGRENAMKSLCAEIRTGRLLTSYHHGQKRFDLGNINSVSCQLICQIRILRNKNKSKAPFPPPLLSSRP